MPTIRKRLREALPTGDQRFEIIEIDKYENADGESVDVSSVKYTLSLEDIQKRKDKAQEELDRWTQIEIDAKAL